MPGFGFTSLTLNNEIYAKLKEEHKKFCETLDPEVTISLSGFATRMIRLGLEKHHEG